MWRAQLDKGDGVPVTGRLTGHFKVIFSGKDEVHAFPEKDLRVGEEHPGFIHTYLPFRVRDVQLF
jgi:hypothetical protein